jgi:hypothetical protein
LSGDDGKPSDNPNWRMRRLVASMQQSNTTDAAFARLSLASNSVATDARFDMTTEQAARVGTVIRAVAAVTGMPLGVVSPLILAAITCNDIYRDCQTNGNDMQRALRNTFTDWRKVSNIVLTFAQAWSSVTTASNAKDWYGYITTPLFQSAARFQDTQWARNHPSAIQILNEFASRTANISPGYTDVNRLPTNIAAGFSLGGGGGEPVFWAKYLAGSDADITRLVEWTTTVLANEQTYRNAEFVGVAATAIATVINTLQFAPGFNAVRDRFLGGTAKERIGKLRKVIINMRDAMGEIENFGVGDTYEEQLTLEVYAKHIQIAANTDLTEPERLEPLMRELARIRDESSYNNWSVSGSGNADAQYRVTKDFGDLLPTYVIPNDDYDPELYRPLGNDGDGGVGAPCIDPHGSVVDLLFQKVQ